MAKSWDEKLNNLSVKLSDLSKKTAEAADDAKAYRELMQEAIDEFNQKVEANIATGDVGVSIGYSVLGRSDKTLRDVFERADKMMYERKALLKSMGAQGGRD